MDAAVAHRDQWGGTQLWESLEHYNASNGRPSDLSAHREKVVSQIRDISTFAIRTLEVALRKGQDIQRTKFAGFPRGEAWNNIRKKFGQGAEIALPLPHTRSCRPCHWYGIPFKDRFCVVPITRTATAKGRLGSCIS